MSASRQATRAMATRGLAVSELVMTPGAAPIDLELVPGTVTGLIGLERNGQEEFLQTLCGLRRPIAGTLTVGERSLGTRGLTSLHEAASFGIAYLPRERKTEGILPSRSVLDNFAIATLPNYSTAGFVRRRRLVAAFERFSTELGIVCSSPDEPISKLSGGNQQKVLLARWLASAPQVLLLNDPSRGVDHPTKQAMHTIYRRLADAGTTVVLLSSEIEELLQVADSTVVFRESSVSTNLARGDMNRESILSAMFGLVHE